MGQAHREAAVDVLRENRRDGYTIPSAELYPFQWCWDSAFVAVGLAGVDPAAARAEIETLCGAAWENGMLPQIAFWTDAEGYFPGPGEWGDATAADGTPTSAISQPPMVVPAARLVWDRTGDDGFRDRVLPTLEAYCEWWLGERSTDGRLVYCRHPWETGMDDSPAWTPVLESFEPGAVEYERRDRKRGELATQRPTDWDYDRYVALLEQGRTRDWNEDVLRETCPFQVVDVLTNTLLVRAMESIATMRAARGDDERAATWRERAAESRTAMRDRLWDAELGTFVSYDRVGERPLRANSVAGLVAPYAGVPTDDQFERLRATLSGSFLGGDRSLACPSYVGPAYDPDRYWRGPVWVNTNWLLTRGLRRYGATDLAERVVTDTVDLVEREGFREYYNPESGGGRGSERFSWSAALYLELTA